MMKRKNKIFPIKKERSKKTLILCTFIALLAIMVLAVVRGNYNIPVKEVFKVIASQLGFGSTEDNNFFVIVWEVRLPRICLAALVGMALAMAGTVFQGVFRNPLVEPYLLSVSNGAACGAAIAIVFLSGTVSVSFMSFFFAIGAMILSYGIATRKGETPLVNLILAGVIVAAIFSAALNLIKTLAPDSKLREISFWLMGGIYMAKWSDVLLMLPCTFASLAALWGLSWKLNVLTMGDQEAATLGIRVGFLKLMLLGISTFITAMAVSMVGIISWIGLMIPHASRMILGPDHRYTIPFSALLGACFLVICDTIARTIIMGEIPISIVTSVLGAPYLIYLLRTNRQVSV